MPFPRGSLQLLPAKGLLPHPSVAHPLSHTPWVPHCDEPSWAPSFISPGHPSSQPRAPVPQTAGRFSSTAPWTDPSPVTTGHCHLPFLISAQGPGRAHLQAPMWKWLTSLNTVMRIWDCRWVVKEDKSWCLGAGSCCPCAGPRLGLLKTSGFSLPNQTSGTTFSALSRIQLFATAMDCGTPGFPVLHHLLELAQTHVHQAGDAIQPSHPLSSPSSPAFCLFQHQGLFQ